MFTSRHIIFWTLLMALLGYSIYSAVKHYDHSPYNDLRNRVVGARLMAAGESPYFHKWQTGEPETWLDPFEKPGQVVNGNTVTPVTLAVFSWMNGWHYDQVKWVWIVFTFACFITALALAYRLLQQYRRPVYLLLLPAALLASVAWKLHLFSGQIYIVYALLLVLFFYLFSIKRFFIAGIIAVLLIALRPPMALVFLPLFLWKFERKMLTGGLTAVLLLAVIHVIKIPSHNWADYFRSMKIHALEIPGEIPEISMNNKPAIVYPQNPEHIQFNNIEARDAYQQQLSPDILSVQKLMPKEGFFAQPVMLTLLLLFTYLLLYVVAAGKKLPRKMDGAGLLLAGFVLYILSEYFLPAPRFTYNFVQWLFPLTVLACSRKLEMNWRLVLLLAALFLNIIKLPFIPDAYSVGELLMLAALLAYLFQTEKTGENNGSPAKFAALL